MKLGVIWQGIKDFWEELFVLMLLNLAWVIMALLIIPLPLATVGLYYVTNRVAQGRAVRFSQFWEGMRLYAGLAYRLFIVDIAVGGILLFNSGFYGRQPGLIFTVLQMLFLALFLFWLSFQFYLWPMVMELEAPSVRLVVRNAISLAVMQPLPTFVLIVISLLLIFLAFIPPLTIFTLALVAVLGNRMARDLLSRYRVPKEPDPLTAPLPRIK
ncbi:MAG: hypothetical protein EXR62_15085 [Chloroflexi bacterium]|nr:hypothetical protein [Chloroflexota bacterium]